MKKEFRWFTWTNDDQKALDALYDQVRKLERKKEMSERENQTKSHWFKTKPSKLRSSF